MNFRPLLAAMLAALLAACAAVPDKLPAPSLPDHVPLAGLPADTGASWPDPQWWHRYHDPQLDHLVALALEGSSSLAQARSRVEQAAQAARVTAAQAGLRIDGNTKLSRQRMSENGLIPAEFLGFTWYTQGDLGIGLRYDFDWWGKHRAAVEAAVGQARAAQAQRSAAALALQASVVDTWFGWLADHARLDLATRQVSLRQKLLRIATLRVRAGLEPADRRHHAKAALAAARQQRAALQGSVQIRQAALAALLGVAPAQLPALQPHPLPEAQAGLPADASLDLIARRPDIAASRWQVQAALRGTDVARAQFLPDLSISALAGLSSIDMDKLLEAGSRTFALTPALHLPIFEGGLLRANYGLADAKLHGAIAQYNNRLVEAAREVASQALGVRRIDAQRREQRKQLAATRALHASAEARRRQGVTDARPALETQAQLLLQRDAAVSLHAQALSAGVALTRALGGGYHSTLPTTPSPAAAARSDKP